MKSFESNLQDNRLPLHPEVDQCRTGPATPEERHFPSSSARDGATCVLTSPIMETSAGRARSRGFNLYDFTASLYLILPLLLRAASLHRTAKIDGGRIKEGHPPPYETSLSYTLREEEMWGSVHRGSRPQWGISPGSKEGQEGCRSKKNTGQECQTQKTTRHS